MGDKSNDVNKVLAIIAIVTSVVVVKVIFCSCMLHLRRRNRQEDTRPILEDTLIERLQEIHQSRIRSRRTREPPPTFEDALVNSRPISYIDVEEPPPTYSDYLNAHCETFLDGPSSVNPSDIVIALDLRSNQNNNIIVSHESLA